MDPADIVYNIADGILAGELDGFRIRTYAGSGGRAGSKVPGAVNRLLANNPFATGVHGAGHLKGPLPMGRYKMKRHEVRSHWIRLDPERGNVMHGRAGFAIHGRGQVGSHGCIVPNDFSVVVRLYDLLAAREKRGEPWPTLEVVAIGADLESKFQLGRNLA